MFIIETTKGTLEEQEQVLDECIALEERIKRAEGLRQWGLVNQLRVQLIQKLATI